MTDEEEFWKFSLSVYDRARDSCLKLQDGFDFDVNLLIFCCWRGVLGAPLDGDELARIIEAIAGWRANVVEPLRTARRWLKNADNPGGARVLRRQILELELKGERLLQALIIEAAEPCQCQRRLSLEPRIEIARRNLELYNHARSPGATAGEEPSFLELLERVFANLEDDGIVAADRGPGSREREASKSESETG